MSPDAFTAETAHDGNEVFTLKLVADYYKPIFVYIDYIVNGLH